MELDGINFVVSTCQKTSGSLSLINLTSFPQFFSNLELAVRAATRMTPYRGSERCSQHIQAAQEIIGNSHKTSKA